jgi:hypothetical protein
MSNTPNADKFVKALSKYGKFSVGSTAKHESGIYYHFEHYHWNNAPYWAVKLWQAAIFEINKNYIPVSELNINGIIYREGHSPFKSGPRRQWFGCSILVKHDNPHSNV